MTLRRPAGQQNATRDEPRPSEGRNADGHGHAGDVGSADRRASPTSGTDGAGRQASSGPFGALSAREVEPGQGERTEHQEASDLEQSARLQ
jgi:hypothetical protein